MFTITEREPRGIARKRSQLSGYRQLCMVSLPEKEHKLWPPVGRTEEDLRSELCAGQPLSAWNQLLCSKNVMEAAKVLWPELLAF